MGLVGSTTNTKTREDEEKEERILRYKYRMIPLGIPSSFRQLKMGDELLDWIAAEDICKWKADQLSSKGEIWKFERAVDQRHIPNHVYYEGYAHALPTKDTVNSMNPRWGTPLDKHRGPPRLVAFVACFKELNEKWIKEAFCSEQSDFLGDLVEKNLHLTDLAMQFHWGDEIANEDIGWHADGNNSMLHMAIGLLGRRALHLSRSEEGHTVHWQNPGDFYIGTPTTVKHAVEYPACQWDDRVLAIQARFLFPTANEKSSLKKNHSSEYYEHVCNTINKADIIIPTLDQVVSFYNQNVE